MVCALRNVGLGREMWEGKKNFFLKQRENM